MISILGVHSVWGARLKRDIELAQGTLLDPASVTAFALEIPEEHPDRLCWKLGNDPSKRPLVLMAELAPEYIGRFDLGVRALLAQSQVAALRLSASLEQVSAAVEQAQVQAAAPNAQALWSEFESAFMADVEEVTAVDVDGTLLRDNGELNPAVLSFIQREEEAGRRVLIWTSGHIGQVARRLRDAGFSGQLASCRRVSSKQSFRGQKIRLVVDDNPDDLLNFDILALEVKLPHEL